ncbi:hypothetical protein HA402_006845 [Bradysia odoriphaga]|nr:hypothetical protein HA402_006845 [Bradysia odoriphaga]
MMKFGIVATTLLIIYLSRTVIAYGGSECDSKSYYKPHPTECTLFYQCSPNGTYILHTCPPDLHFSPILNVCDFPDEAGCSKNHTVGPGDGETTNSPDPGTSTTVESVEKCNDGEYKPHETECDEFYRCISGTFILINCPDGTQFNVTSKVCVVQEGDCNEDDRSSASTVVTTTELTTEALTNTPTDFTTNSSTDFSTTDSTTEETDSTTEATDSTTEETDSTTEANDTTTESTDSTTESNDSTTEANDSTTEATDATAVATDSTTKATESTTEELDSTTETTDSTTESNDSTTESNDSTTEATDSTTEKTDLTTETTDSTIEETTEAETTTTQCVNNEYRPDENDCEAFYRCINGRFIKLFCSIGTHFDPKTRLCVDPDIAGCNLETDRSTNSPEITEITTSPATENSTEVHVTIVECHDNEYRPDESDCEAFYRCINGRFVKLFCSIGTNFDPNTRLCVDPEVAECNLETDQSANSLGTTEVSPSSSTEASTEAQAFAAEACQEVPTPNCNDLCFCPCRPPPGGKEKDLIRPSQECLALIDCVPDTFECSADVMACQVPEPEPKPELCFCPCRLPFCGPEALYYPNQSCLARIKCAFGQVECSAEYLNGSGK